MAGTTLKVVELVGAQQAHGWSPEELHFQFPHLTMAQIHGALAYYWDHQPALDADLASRNEFALRQREAAARTPLARKLRKLKHSR
ncbi:MAG TPA: DUF433 domain-containing protein [Thermoanaerobaculia bacterium]|nr:DUF433 domain-containing protein [Thermoanaerobaculia bacterium]